MNKLKFVFIFILMLPTIYPGHDRAEGSGLIATAMACDPSGAAFASGGPGNCSGPAGTSQTITARLDMPLAAAGNDSSGNLQNRGEQTGPTVAASLTATAGTITAAPLHPDLATPSNEAILGKGSVAFTWTGESGASASRYRIQVSKNFRFTPIMINTVAKAGSYKTRAALASGVYSWRVRAEDKVKKSGTWSPSWKFTIDTNAPTNTTVKKIINGGKKVTTAALVSLALSAKDKIGVTAYHVSERKKKPYANDPDWVDIVSAKSYTAKINYALSDTRDGKKTVYVRFKDAAGNVSETKKGTIILHTSKPDTTINHQPAKLTNSTSASFGFVSDKRGSRFRCSLDNGEYSACIHNSMSYKDLSAGPHTFNVKAIDNVGNAEQIPASYAWTIDLTPPDTEITTQPTPTSRSASADFGFSSTKTASTFHCKLDDGPYAECTSPMAYTALAEGPHTFFVRATDEAGNSDPTPANYTWTVDLFQTTITSQPPNPSNSTTASFSFTSRKPGATYQCKLDNVEYSACVSAMVYTGLTENNHTFTVRAIYDAGKQEADPAKYSWAISLPPLVKTRGGFINRTSRYLTYNNVVNLSLAASSAKGVAGYYVSENPCKPDAADSKWIKIPRSPKEFTRVVPFTLSAGKGTKNVYVCFKDTEENVSEVIHDSIYSFNSNYVLLILVLLQAALFL